MRRSGRRIRNPQLQEKSEQPFFSAHSDVRTKGSPPFFQAKGLTVGQPGDKYEQEADAVADSVVNNSGNTPAIQEKEISHIQRETLATPVEDEKYGTAEQRMEKDKLIQEKPEVQAQEEVTKEEEEMSVQTMHEEEEEVPEAQRTGVEEEEEDMGVQAKSEGGGNNTANSTISNQIKSSASNGKPLSGTVKSEMESSFGRDFSDVNIHTDDRAKEMNRSLRAQAFTHGKDIYFNSGKYNPETSAGKHLLAHELTHVVQQNKDAVSRKQQGEIQLKPSKARSGNSGATGGKGGTTCGKPSGCPADFCTPFPSTVAARAARSTLSPVLLSGIAAKVSPRVVPLWSQYLFGGAAPQNLSSQFGVDFMTSLTTRDTTQFLVDKLMDSLKSSPPTFPAGVNTVVIDIPIQIPSAVTEIGTAGSTNEMNFDVIGEIPGNIAGGMGTTQLSCPVGARPSPFNDGRIAKGKAVVTRNPGGTLTVLPIINYTVKDTIDLCPGNCGATIEQIATIPMSKMEASGISGDVPFTVNFPSMPIAPLTITPSVPIPVSPVPGKITASALRIRRKPNLSAKILDHYPRGTVVDIICKVSGSSVKGNSTWYKTNKGYISGYYVTLTGSAPSSC